MTLPTATPPVGGGPRTPLNVIGIAFGTSGLAGTWTAARVQLHAPAVIGDILWMIAALVWVAVIARYLTRSGGPRAILGDLRHPVLGPFAALYPVVGSLLAAHLADTLPVVATIGVAIGAVLSSAFGAWFVASLLGTPRDPGTLHGGYLLPTVAATLLTAQSLATVGAHTLAMGFVGIGILFWMLVGAMLLTRFATGPAVPPALMPTLAIMSAPPAVAGNAWWTVTDGAPSVVHTLLGALMVAFLLPHLALVRRYLRTGFAIGFWAMTFTAAASATYGIRLLTQHDASPAAVAIAWTIVAAATLLVVVIAVRSVMLVVPRHR